MGGEGREGKEKGWMRRREDGKFGESLGARVGRGGGGVGAGWGGVGAGGGRGKLVETG